MLHVVSNQSIAIKYTLSSSESIWSPPFRTGVHRNEEPPPDRQVDKKLSLSQFILSLFEGARLLPGDLAGLLKCRSAKTFVCVDDFPTELFGFMRLKLHMLGTLFCHEWR